jgi:tRNA-splicing ligase RtcB (3'-phosphate/5'-hydroxy nucleic acid ligase)
MAFPIGGVAATRYPEGVISPGGIGYDINCGVRLLASSISFEEAEPFIDLLATALDQHCPSGVGKKGGMSLTSSELDEVCRHGSRWALKQGMATEQDVRRTEEQGSLSGADPTKVSRAQKNAAARSLGRWDRAIIFWKWMWLTRF